MADMRRFLDFTGLGIYDAKIKEVISTGDAAALADAKKYFDDNKGLFEAAGTVKTAKEALQAAIDAVDAKVNAIKDGETIDSFADVEAALAGKQAVGDYATKTEAQGYANAKDESIAAAKKAGDDAQDALDAYILSNDAAVQGLTDYVGTIPTGSTATNVVAYVQEKTSGIASEGAMTELGNRVTLVEGDVATIKGDYLTSTTKTELEGKISTAQAAADSAQAHSEGVASDLAEAVEALEGADASQIERIAALEGTIVGLSGAMHFEGVKDALPENTDGYEQGDVIIVGNKEYVANGDKFVEFGDASVNAEAITALTGRVDTLTSDMTQAKTDIDNAEAAILLKADQTAVDEIGGKVTTVEGKVSTLEGKMTTAEGNITTLQGDMTQAQTDIAALQDKFGDGENSVSDMISDAVAVETSARETAVSGVQSQIDALSGVVDTKAAASDVETISGKVGTLETKVGTLETEMDAVEAAVAGKAASSDLTALAGRVTTAEGKITTLESEMDAVEGRLDDAEEAIDGKAAQSDVDSLTTRMSTAEGNISANTAALAKFTEITETEINSLFA